LRLIRGLVPRGAQFPGGGGGRETKKKKTRGFEQAFIGRAGLVELAIAAKKSFASRPER